MEKGFVHHLAIGERVEWRPSDATTPIGDAMTHTHVFATMM